MNIQTRAQFDEALSAIQSSDTLVVDTETNTLRVIQNPAPMVSIQVYIPDTDTSYNFPFRQGHGVIEVPYNKANPEGTSYADMSWSGRTKATVMLHHYYNMWKADNSTRLGNLPSTWLDELKRVFTPDKTYVFHNARFDMHVMETEGFMRPERVIDTQVALGVAWNDWRGTKVSMNEEMVWGSRKLKWQTVYWGQKLANSRNPEMRAVGESMIENGELGEATLHANMESFQTELADYIVSQLEADYETNSYWLDGIIYASYRKNPTATDKDGMTWRSRQVQRVANKLKLDDKSDLWMLPASAVATYGELDVVITWQLWVQLRKLLEAWDDLEFTYELCDIQTHLAFRMERNGMLLDADECYTRFQNILKQADMIATQYEADLNIASNKQLIEHIGIKGKNPKVDSDTLQRIIEDDSYPDDKRTLAQDVLTYRKLGKEANTYLSRWYYARDSKNYIHGSFDVTGTRTGRMSSSGDAGNLQNVPKRTYDICEVIIPPTGQLLWAIDYGQLEARLASWIAEYLYRFDKDLTMTTLFNDGVDMHSYTAKMLEVRHHMFGDMTSQEIADARGLTYDSSTDIDKLVYKAVIRQAGKTLNFGLLYGGSAGMAKNLLGIEDYLVADVLVESWNNLFTAFTESYEYHRRVGLERRATPAGVGNMYMYTQTPVPFYISEGKTPDEFWYGRNLKHHLYEESRYVRDKFTSDWVHINPRTKSAEKSWNGVVQGLGGYICTKSGERFYRECNHDGVEIFAQIHDALDGYADVTKLGNIKNLIDVMLDWNTNPLLEVELEAGLDNWQHMREVKDFELWVDSRGREGY